MITTNFKRDTSKPFRIYLNLGDKQDRKFSILAYNPEKKGYRLWAHAKDIHAHWVTPKVYEATRQRIIRKFEETGKKEKEVHAFLEAEQVVFPIYPDEERAWVESKSLGSIMYNPFKMDTFKWVDTLSRFRNGKFVVFSIENNRPNVRILEI